MQQDEGVIEVQVRRWGTLVWRAIVMTLLIANLYTLHSKWEWEDAWMSDIDRKLGRLTSDVEKVKDDSFNIRLNTDLSAASSGRH